MYYNLIDETLKLNPNQKFYISHDLSDNLIKHFSEKYGNKIITRQNFYHLIDKYENTGLNHIVDCIDLICLSNTKLVVGSNHSTWSRFAQDYKTKQKIEVTLDFQIDEYLNLYKEINK